MRLQNTNLNIRIPKKMREQLVEIAKEQGVSYSVIVRNLIKKYIAKNMDVNNV
jgi:predicted DNA-binding protein|nr:MAG TPA: hypothetical protein [Caudoviricetes sp.]